MAALGLRLWGATYGLPAVYNPDEVAIMNRTLALWPNRLNPENFLYPSFYFYLLFVWEGLWFLLGRLTGAFASVADFERTYFVDPTSLFVAGRVLTALMGTVTVWITWRIGRRLFDASAGLLAAGLLALAPLAVRDAHYVKHDVPATLFVTVALLGATWAVANWGSRSAWWLAGVAGGLAVSTHYYAVFVLLPLLVLAYRPSHEARDNGWLRVVAVGAGAAGAFALTSPFLLLEPSVAWRDIIGNRQIVVDRVTTSATGPFGSLGYYLTSLWRDGLGPFGALLAVVGLVPVWQAGWRHRVVVLLFPVVFLAFIANTFPASRYLNAIVPSLAIAAGVGASWLSRHSVLTVRGVGMALGFAAVVGAAVASVRTNRFVLETDTRTLATEWIATNVTPGASILIQPYSVPLRQSREGLAEALTAHVGDPARATVRFRRQLALDPYPAPAYRTVYLGAGGLDVDKIYVAPDEFEQAGTLEPARTRGVTHVVMKRYNVDDPAMAAIARALEREGRLLVTFSPYRSTASAARRQTTAPFLHNTDVHIASALERPGPIIDIWSVN
jgi:hypothetical protein